MVIAKFKHSAPVWTVEISGHAEYGQLGKSIVCAACSILEASLRQTMINFLENERIKDFIYKDDGQTIRMHIKCSPIDTGIDDVIGAIYNGFLLLQSSYPGNVKVFLIAGEK